MMDSKQLKDGVPCSHKGCLSHISHPCEGCGRVWGIDRSIEAFMQKLVKEEKNFDR